MRPTPPETCPSCGMRHARSVLVDVNRAKRQEYDERYACGSVYWTAQQRFAFRSEACRVIQDLREQLMVSTGKGQR